MYALHEVYYPHDKNRPAYMVDIIPYVYSACVTLFLMQTLGSKENLINEYL